MRAEQGALGVQHGLEVDQPALVALVGQQRCIARSGFGLTQAHGPADIAYAVVEGVSFGLRDGLDTLTRPTGALALVGGGARSAWWSQLLADILEVPLTLGEGGEAGGALGAARLAWLADGGTVEAVCTTPAVRQRFEPRTADAEGHRRRHARFKALYLGLRGAFGSR